MSTAKTALFALYFSLATCQCIAGQAEQSLENNGDLRVSDKDIPALRVSAADGNAESALKLAKYFDFYRDDHTQAMVWYSIAAENGDRLAQCRLAKVLRAESDEFAQHRSVFWQKKCDEAR